MKFILREEDCPVFLLGDPPLTFTASGRRIVHIDFDHRTSDKIPISVSIEDLLSGTIKTIIGENGASIKVFFYKNQNGELMFCPTWAVSKEIINDLMELYKDPTINLDLKDAIYLTKL